MKRLLPLLLAAMLLVGCSVQADQPLPAASLASQAAPTYTFTYTKIAPTMAHTPSPFAPAPTLAPSPTAFASAVSSFTPSPLPTPSQTPTPHPLTAQVTYGELNLRAGPSKLFPILNNLGYGTQVEVFGAAPGREWLHVRAPNGETGWLKTQYIRLDAAVESLPTLTASPDWLTLRGIVKDGSGKPVFGAYVVLHDGQNHGTDGKSWEDGRFFIYLPKQDQGNWNLAVVGVDCVNYHTNPICRQPGRFSDNPRLLDVQGDMTVEFIYQYP